MWNGIEQDRTVFSVVFAAESGQRVVLQLGRTLL